MLPSLSAEMTSWNLRGSSSKLRTVMSTLTLLPRLTYSLAAYSTPLITFFIRRSPSPTPVFPLISPRSSFTAMNSQLT
jgi:hypothetical protein